jgi:hypothetical protein
MQTKTYGNRFATMEKQSDGSWVVYNEVLGMPVGDWVGNSGDLKIRSFPNYQSARSQVVFMYQYYSSLE